ncbi:MAG: U32 family peptidase [Rhodospirillales bacterium]|jgi:collagenase-like PrtC family protease|nr:U32 family peptidase [Rhodospirillales bacterium]
MAAAANETKLTLGPVLFNWPPEAWRDFYFRIADEAPVDTVSIGEVVCSKRSPFFAPHLAQVVERLEAAGKEVVHATLALIMSDDDLQAVRALAGDEEMLVEANDISAVSLLAGRRHTIGPLVNVYSEGTLAALAEQGAERVCLPPEMPARIIAALAKTAEPELEVQVFGRLPLALSVRCYHARSRNLHKDGCQFVCADDPDGMAVETLDGDPFVAVNGTQTLSHAWCNLVRELAQMKAAGLCRFRLSPQDVDMVAVAGTFRDVLDGRLEADAAFAALAEIAHGSPFSNGFYHGTEGVRLVEPAVE